MIEVTKVFPTCDICGKKTAYTRKCKLCGKNVCLKCHAWYAPTGCGDYLNSYCTECWKLGIACRSKIEKTIKKFNSDLERLEEEWADIVNKNMEGK